MTSTKFFLRPRYTGYVPGVHETFKKGPIPSQIECMSPDADSFIRTRTQVAPIPQPDRDACNNPENSIKSHQATNLWPALQATAAQEPCRPPPASVAFGDLRVDVFRTSYNQDFKVSLRISIWVVLSSYSTPCAHVDVPATWPSVQRPALPLEVVGRGAFTCSSVHLPSH